MNASSFQETTATEARDFYLVCNRFSLYARTHGCVGLHIS
ncbi:MAG: hypothetical protein N4J56_007961 [Chroococcidiopsis sp. SAG 2025]|nr:hypothetical protein [Chroococcidiopsis sp. SAG 2025]